MEKELIRLILNYSFWEANKRNILSEFFSSQTKSIFELVQRTHEKYKRNLSANEIKILYFSENPTMTFAAKENIESILNNLPSEIGEDIAKEIIRKAWITETGRRITILGTEIVNGEEIKIEETRKILQQIEEGNISGPEELEAASNDLNDILAAISVTTAYPFNLGGLHNVASGIGPGIFCIVFARPEVGKTSCWISLCCAPNGFAYNNDIEYINAYCNEEPVQRVQGRAAMACSGMPLAEMLLNTERAQDFYNQIKGKIRFYDIKGASFSIINRHIHNTRPSICIFDQLDKIAISGSFARNDERLGALYSSARDSACINNCAVIAISQANANAEGKTYMSSANLAEALTSKAAEADLCIGIGKHPQHEENLRVLNMVKNKITGNHTEVVCTIQPEISRYVS